MRTARLTWAAGVLALIVALWMAPCAGAESVGEIANVGEFGGALGQFTYPPDLAVDPSEDNSVFVLDEPGAENAGIGASIFRIQKFSAALGMPDAHVEIPTPAHGTEERRWIANIAVDPTLGRLYVLEGTETPLGGSDKDVALQIDAYSTSDVIDNVLQPAPEVETNHKPGVFYEFPAMPTEEEFENGTLPAIGTLREPGGMTVEQETHALVINGTTEGSNVEVQRIAAVGQKFTSGQFVEAFQDTSEKLTHDDSPVAGVAAGPEEGVIYVTAHNLGGRTSSDREPGVAKLATTGAFSLAKPDITVIKQSEAGEQPILTGGQLPSAGSSPGSQISVSSDGKTVYAAEQSVEGTEGTAGSYEVRGMSTAGGATQVVFGGGASRCLIASDRNAIAAGGDGVVYALDDGNWIGAEPTTPTSFGFHLIEFGPGGSGCPSPSTAITIDGDKSAGAAKVSKGQSVELEASDTELHNEEPVKLVWTVEGPEKFNAESTGKPAELKFKRRLLQPGVYTVKLEMQVSPESYGPVPLVTRNIEVSAPLPSASFEVSNTDPKSGEAVSFNAAESLDPAGECSLTSGCSATHKLKSYVWNFGDGSAEVTSATPEVKHAFADTGSYTVTLAVTNEEGEQSSPTTQTVAVQGTSTTTTSTQTQTSSSQTETVTTKTSSTVRPEKPKKESDAEKLKHALLRCKKDKSKKLRARCEAAAKRKYASKSRTKAKKAARNK
jgi:hypothetical protein